MDSDERIRILVVDDHAILRRGLSALLMTCDDLLMVGKASDGWEAVKLCDELEPDVVLMDLIMPVMDGITATSIITQHHPNVRVLILTSSDSDRGSALRVGAHGYIHKTALGSQITEAIRSTVP